MGLRLVPVLALLVAACGRPAAHTEVRPDTRFSLVKTAAASPAGVVVASDPAGEKLEYSFAAAMRLERWDEALAAIDAEPPDVQQRPEVRYAAAAAAERVGDAARVVALLNDLESALPLLAPRIRERRARAALSARDAAVALAYYRQQTDAQSQLRAAQSLAVMGDHVGARATALALLAKLPKRGNLCSVEAPAHKLLSESYPENSVSDVARELRWLALSAPLCPASQGAAERLDALGGPLTLDKRERGERARVFADAGLIDETERELAAIEKARGVGPDAATILALRGTARYEARKDLDRAVELLSSAAAMNKGRKAEWQYTAARARIRAGKMAQAIELLDGVRKLAPGTLLGETSEYKRAQLLYSTGRFDEAVRAYDVYLARYGRRARFLADAEDERSIAWVVTGKPNHAAAAFAQRAKTAEPPFRARYGHLEGVAWLKAGDRTRGEARLRDVVREYPFSFAALAAAERLEALGLGRPALPAAVPPASAADAAFELPPEAKLLHALGLDREAELALGEVERKVSQSFAAEGGRALCSLYQRFSSAERRYRVGQNAVTSEELNGVPRSDRLWAWDCVYPRPYPELVQGQAFDRGLDAELIYAVMRQESGFRPEVVSPARAVGLLQIMPSTGERVARELGLDFTPEQLRSPRTNVRLGAAYLRKLLDVFDGNLPLAVASYNAGPNAVLGWLDGGRNLDVDLFVARIPYAETRTYVERVLSNYVRYKYLTGGQTAVPRISLALPTPKTDGVELY